MINRLLDKQIDAELIAAFIFMAISGFYIITKYGVLRIHDVLLLWMFPASVMIFLTLLIVKIVEKIYENRSYRKKYVPLG
jgi:hypothetical protein